MPAAALTKTQPNDGNNVKRSVLRVIGLAIVTSGLYYFYWFFVTKNQLKRETKNDQHVGWQTVGLVVPILNLFIHYWLYRDINNARATQKQAPFPAVWYVIIPVILLALAAVIGIGSIISLVGSFASAINDNDGATAGLAGAGVVGGLFALLLLFLGAVLEYVFLGLAIKNLNEYWDKRSGGKALAAKFRGGEVAIIVIGVLLMILNYSGNYTKDTDNDIDLNLDDLSSPALETTSPTADSSSSIDY